MPDDENDRIADALRELSGAPQSNPDHPAPGPPRARVPRPIAPEPKAARPPVPEPAPRPTPEPQVAPGEGPTEASGLEQIIDGGDLVAFPAPSEAELLSAALRRTGAAHHGKPRSLTLQRTLIPVLLTLALLLPAFGTWLMLRPPESELRLYGQRLMIYLSIGGAVFLALAIVNMIQVRGAQRAARGQAAVR